MFEKTFTASAPKPAAPVTSTSRPSPRSACARVRMSSTVSRKRCESPLSAVACTGVMISAARPLADGIGPWLSRVSRGRFWLRSATTALTRASSPGVSRLSFETTVTAAAVSPPGKRLTASRACTDSVSPGKNDDVSFFCAFSNLPANVPPMPPATSSAASSTKNFALRPAGNVSIHRKLRREGRLELIGRRDRKLAGEVLADVGGGSPVDGLAALEQRHRPVSAGQHDVRVVRAADDAGELAQILARECDLAHRALQEVHRAQQVTEGEWVLGRDGVQQLDQRDRG